MATIYGFEKAKQALEYDKIIDFISSKCVSETGRNRLSNSQPLTDPVTLNKILIQIGEMREIYLADGGLPIWEFEDIRLFLNRIEPAESYLEIADCLKIQSFLEIVADISAFFIKLKDKYPELTQIVGRLAEKKTLLNQLKFTIDPSGQIYDNASNELKTIRKAIHQLQNEVHIRLQRIIRKNSEFLQEEYITLREGRLVLPVREYSVSKIKGIVHGQSGSGATYFVEPMEAVDLNNQIQKLFMDENKEIIKILKRLSNSIREEQTDLIKNLNILTDLDVLQAKAKYANEFNANFPEVNNEFYWDLRNGKHPVLLKKIQNDTVPLNLLVGKDNNELIISGPNAGGKTVTLKTIGLLQLLFQSGFHIPVDEGTRMPVCSQIFTVIGDKQSIEQDLSTFSSHIKDLNEILNKVDDKALVLIDEIGSGTEPSGGAALAIAILEKLNRRGIITIVTTHQNQLKSFGGQTEGIGNAAMQFDSNHLTPLFSLEMGIPGSSYTFEICRRLGLDESMLERAVSITGQETFKLDQLLADVVRKSQHYRELSEKLSIKESELNGLIKLYGIKNETFTKNRKKLEKESLEEAKMILANVNKEIEAVIREIRESQGDRTVIKKAKEAIERKKKEIDAGLGKKKGSSSLNIEQLVPGQKVRSKSFGFTGVVSKIFKGKKEVEINRDGVKITVNWADIDILDEHGQVKDEQPREQMRQPSGMSGVSANIPNELDLRGLVTEDAISEIEAYLDLAVLSSWDEVCLIHGKGTGALRQAVHKFLSGLKNIKSFRLGKWGEGDAGVTIVTLR
ncbi:MAG: endonuclease MutS2 [Calditrichaceae bacterium]